MRNNDKQCSHEGDTHNLGHRSTIAKEEQYMKDFVAAQVNEYLVDLEVTKEIGCHIQNSGLFMTNVASRAQANIKHYVLEKAKGTAIDISNIRVTGVTKSNSFKNDMPGFLVVNHCIQFLGELL